MLWIPAARRYSIDAWLGVSHQATRSVPFWTIFVLRGQLCIAYFYAGVAKFHLDWFMDAVPVRWFLADPNVTAPYEPFLSPSQLEAFRNVLHSSQFAYFLSWTGAIFDVSIAFLLLFRRSRIFGLILMLIFHATNHFLIFDDIGWFPIVGAATALIFLDADWPERLWRWLRQPRLKKPDRWWALTGGLAFPLVGMSLGWRLNPTPVQAEQKQFPIGRLVVPCVLGWLMWQSLLPIRHHFIDGDARFTYEGFSFSWRLKADTRHARGHSLRIADSKVISKHPYARALINWDEWPYDPVVHRRVQAGRVVWPAMPEFSIVLEPLLGERVVYNPFSGLHVSHANDTAARRVRSKWRELYGHEPQVVVPLSVSDTVDEIVSACNDAAIARAECDQLESLQADIQCFEQGLANPEEAGTTLRHVQLLIRNLLEDKVAAGLVRPIVRKIYPLALHGESRRSAPFFIVEDPEVLREELDGSTRIVRSKWKHNASTRQPGVPFDSYEGAIPLLVYMGTIGADVKHLLPQAYITDTHGNKNTPPRIQWNSLRDMTMSKFMHASGQAFYLRRYARRVASLWEAKCGRRPAVYATTGVSYNGRPHQKLVEPNVDLACVPVCWFSHNKWINDLEIARIPRAAVEKPSGFSMRKR
jgi:hypothetical protein